MCIILLEICCPLFFGLCMNMGLITLLIFHIFAVINHTLTNGELLFTIFLMFVCTVNIGANIHFMIYSNRQTRVLLFRIGINLSTILISSFSLFWIFYSIRTDLLIISYIFNIVLFFVEGREIACILRENSLASIPVVHSSSRVVPGVTLNEQLNKDPEYVCPICLSEAKYCVKFKCNHSVCTECTKELLKVSNRCPCCRDIIYAENCHPEIEFIHLQTV